MDGIVTTPETTRATTKTPNVVNGINVDNLFALIEASKDPVKAKTHWRVATAWQGQTRVHAEVDGFSIGGTNTHANPQEYLLAALNACVTVGYVAQCSVRGIELEYVEIETTGEIDLRGFLGIDPGVANGYESLTYTVRIKGNGTPEQFAEVHEAVIATSPNFYNVSHPVTLKPTLVVE